VSGNAVAIEPPRNLTAVLLVQTLTAEDLEPIRSGLQKMYAAVPEVKLAMVSSAGVQFAGPFPKARDFKAALAEIEAPANTANPVDTQFYERLLASLRDFGSDWSSVVLVGRFPGLDPPLDQFGPVFMVAKLAERRVRASYWNLAPNSPPILDVLARGTGGFVVKADLGIFLEWLTSSSQSFAEISWTDPKPLRGFELITAQIRLSSGAVDVPRFAAAAGVELPDMAKYALYRQQLDLAASNGVAEDQFRSSLETVLSINPGDAKALRLGADFQIRHGDHRRGAEYLAWLNEVQPGQGALLAELGHEQFLGGDLNSAEKNLMAARELHVSTPTMSEHLMQIHVSRSDHRGALPFLEEVLKADAKRQDLWLLRADTAAKLNDWKLQADSIEHALALGSAPFDRRTALVRLYLEHGDPERGAVQVDAALAGLPKDASVHATCAGFLEQLQRPDDALGLWRKAVELDPANEPAHSSVTRLLMAKKDWNDALSAAEAGLAVAPGSARLHLAQATALERQDRIYDARRALEQAASIEDVDLLRYRARLEDAYGVGAPRAYRQLAEALDKSASADLPATLERGLEVSIRDADDQQASWFSGRLQRGVPSTTSQRDLTHGMWIPGGFAALAFIARGKANSTPDEFMFDYARAIIGNGGTGPKPVLAYLNPLKEYFERLGALLQLGTMHEHQAVITLSLADKNARQKTTKILDLIGWKLVEAKGKFSVQSGTKASQARRQDFASALAIDQVGMESAFAAGKSYELVIPFEWATVALDEPTWRAQFYANEKWAGGLAEALARMPQIAPAYAGLAAVNRTTAAALVASIGLKNLVEKHGPELAAFSSALVVADGHVETPGGAPASPAWGSLAGAPAADPSRFLRALIEKDDGMLMTFFFTLGQLDLPHQRFFTRSLNRLTRFYDVFRESPEAKQGGGRRVYEESVGPFLRQVPLDSDGSVDFPGSPEVWMVAKGQSTSASRTAQLLKKAHKKAAPDVEDEILVRLARTRYGHQRSELDNFLAVVRIDAHRMEPLDENSALSLAQSYPRYSTVYPYFHVLTGLTAREFSQFFRFGEKLQGTSPRELNAILGPFYSVLELIRLGMASHALTEAQSTDLFFDLCDRFTRAGSASEYTQAALAVSARLAGSRNAEATAAIRDLLIPARPAVRFELEGPRTADPTAIRRAGFDRVLHLQSIPPLEASLDLWTAAHAVATGKGPVDAQLRILDEAVAKLPAVELSKAVQKGTAGKPLAAEQPDKVAAVVARIRKKATERKVNPKDLEKLEQELLAELAPTVRLTLSGLVYAYYFRPDDLLISDDPLFVRKHRFVDFADNSKTVEFAPSEVRVGDDAQRGTFMTGGFAGFAMQVARAALAGAKYDGNIGDIAAAQLAAIRAAPWVIYGDADQRLLGLKLRVAREWCVRAGFDPHARQELADATLGMLSLGRRLDLLDGLAQRDWPRVRRALTTSDLYFLGDLFLAQHPDGTGASPAAAALKLAAHNDEGETLNILGPLPSELFGCDHPHLLPLAPYEEFERHVTIGPIGERSSEFKIYLSEFLDRRGIPAGAIGVLSVLDFDVY